MIAAGDKYNRLTAVAVAGKDRHGHKTWRFRCDCGNEIEKKPSTVTGAHTKSCGCLNSELRTQNNRARAKHGHRGANGTSSEYSTWVSMNDRCTNPNNESYERYGGRGITVCDRWRSFVNFLADMGLRPSPKHTLEREDNDGNYEPSNVRWATMKDQARNRRSSVFVTFRGRRMTVAEAIEISGLKKATVWFRLYRGMTIDQACSEPIRKPNDLQRRLVP